MDREQRDLLEQLQHELNGARSELSRLNDQLSEMTQERDVLRERASQPHESEQLRTTIGDLRREVARLKRADFFERGKRAAQTGTSFGMMALSFLAGMYLPGLFRNSGPIVFRDPPKEITIKTNLDSFALHYKCDRFERQAKTVPQINMLLEAADRAKAQLSTDPEVIALDRLINASAKENVEGIEMALYETKCGELERAAKQEANLNELCAARK